MAKYSIIIPVYNGGPYLRKCLDSILSQRYDDYDIVIVNDGSTDDTEEIIKEYDNDKIRYYKKENGGVSDARNYGVDKVESEFFTFVDADDYVSNRMLSIIDKNLDADNDMLSFNISLNDKFGKVIKEIRKPVFNDISGERAIVRFIEKGELFDTPVAYVYRTKYFKENGFKYAKGRVHEDFGLTPLAILKAKSITGISDYLYYYVQNDNSITQTIDPAKNAKRAWDMLYHFDYLYLNVNNDVNISKNVKKIFNSFIANAVIYKATTLKGKELREYIGELRNRHVSSLLLNDTMNRILKKLVVKCSVNLYLNLFAKRRR